MNEEITDLPPTRAKPRPSCLVSGIFFLLIILGLGYYIYSAYLKNPCKVPVKYAIGNVDSRFKISNSEVLSVAEDAANRWNSETAGQVLIYDQSASLKINLVYDERQANVDKLNSEVASLDLSGNAINSARSRLESMISAYESDLENYNNQVDYWNSRGGAPADVYAQLQSTQKSLNSRRLEINNYIGLINRQIDEHNSNLTNLNSEIAADQNKIITQGLYYPLENKIDIFTFGNKEELRLVLMHELGHALSLDHDLQSTSIMYPILGSQNLSDPTLSTEDLNSFNSNCRSALAPISRAWQRLINLFKSPSVLGGRN